VLQLKKSCRRTARFLPIGLAYVAAALRDAGHRLQVIDAPGEAIDRVRDVDSPIGKLAMTGLSPEEIVARLDPATQVLGITHMFLHEWPTIRKIAELAKARFPQLIVVLGGENATAFWRWMFEQTDAVDYLRARRRRSDRARAVRTARRRRERREREGRRRARRARVAGAARQCGTLGAAHAPDDIPRPAVGVVPRRELPRARRQPRREPRPLDPDARDARLPVPLHLLLVAADVDHEVR